MPACGAMAAAGRGCRGRGIRLRKCADPFVAGGVAQRPCVEVVGDGVCDPVFVAAVDAASARDAQDAEEVVASAAVRDREIRKRVWMRRVAVRNAVAEGGVLRDVLRLAAQDFDERGGVAVDDAALGESQYLPM
jgi:hypothetical protein